MLRQILKEGDIVVHPGNPRVVLCVESHHQYGKDLEDQLNYQERDDQLIGTAYEFARLNPSDDVRLLTHDAAPMFTANDVGLAGHLISDDWLLPPETTETEKKLVSLQAENARLKKAEPSLSLRCIDHSDSQVERYEYTYKCFDPLTDEQIDELMHRLRAYFPLANDFGPTEPQTRIASQSMIASQSILDILGKKEVFTPATADEIAKYREQAYPQWMEQCEQVLRQYHSILQKEAPPLGFSFLAKNDGTRPAADCLITVEARGSFQIMPPPFKDDDNDEMREPQPRLLSLPPNPPTGLWQNMMGHLDLDQIGRTLRQIADVNRNLAMFPHPPFVSSSDVEPTLPDPNGFYYKPNRPCTPQRSFSLECRQWRHENEEEGFFGDIHVTPDQDTAEGTLVCRIQASVASHLYFRARGVGVWQFAAHDASTRFKCPYPKI